MDFMRGETIWYLNNVGPKTVNMQSFLDARTLLRWGPICQLSGVINAGKANQIQIIFN